MKTTIIEEASKRPRYDLEKLLDEVTPDYQPVSFDDAPVGEEEL